QYLLALDTQLLMTFRLVSVAHCKPTQLHAAREAVRLRSATHVGYPLVASYQFALVGEGKSSSCLP
ncbi:MAG TPA: hypothetical protein VGM27_20390, partial [Acidobacteriaceae bacterium]